MINDLLAAEGALNEAAIPLQSSVVARIYLFCAFLLDDPVEDYLPVVGVSALIAFNKKRIEDTKQQISDLIYQLSKSFVDCPEEDGVPFLIACENSNGFLWGTPVDAERLIMLGIAANIVRLIPPDAENVNQIPSIKLV